MKKLEAKEEQRRRAFERQPHGPEPWRMVRQGLAEVMEIIPFAIQFADEAGLHATFLKKVSARQAKRIGRIITSVNPEAMELPVEDLAAVDQVPRQVFSEVMRDIDLFIAVCSVGNDPNWHNRDNAIGIYWQGYSFGELSATAQTRKTVLAELIPRLAIAPQCTLSDRFLIVRGALRTYKIHLGSANILMEPNDQYLCIVPDRKMSKTGTVFLPFEGDSTLDLIVSKAFLLAADEKIADSAIARQIRN